MGEEIWSPVGKKKKRKNKKMSEEERTRKWPRARSQAEDKQTYIEKQ